MLTKQDQIIFASQSVTALMMGYYDRLEQNRIRGRSSRDIVKVMTITRDSMLGSLQNEIHSSAEDL